MHSCCFVFFGENQASCCYWDRLDLLIIQRETTSVAADCRYDASTTFSLCLDDYPQFFFVLHLTLKTIFILGNAVNRVPLVGFEDSDKSRRIFQNIFSFRIAFKNNHHSNAVNRTTDQEIDILLKDVYLQFFFIYVQP